MRDRQERVDHDEAYRDDPGLTTPEMQPGHGELVEAVEAEVRAGAVALGLGAAGVALAGEVERRELDEVQDVARGGRENHDRGVDSVR
ncbi:MAG: hypothetical protein FJ038_05025 [Chloroflexi bacterium]|nr:hypothetical protein [Chloroflexota bacterium]